MMGTCIPNGSIRDSFSRKEEEAACMNNSSDTEEENEKHAHETLFVDAKPPMESGSSLRGCKRLALALSVVAFLASFTVLLYVIVMFATQLTHRKHEKNTITTTHPATHPEVCLDCERLVQNPYTQPGSDPVLEGLTRRMEDNVMKCCAGNQGQMSTMLKLVARRQDTKKSVNSSSVVVHKQMISERMDSSTGMTDYSVVEFNRSNEAVSEQCQGAENIGHGIVILISGTYYVYSNVLFNNNGTGKTSSKQTWSSHVHRRSPQSNTRTGILLTAVHTRCTGCPRDKLSSFTGGVFQLQSGDLIQVFLSDKGVVQFNKVSSYLGLVMLNGQKGHSVLHAEYQSLS